MFHGFFLGILGGVAVAKLVSRCRSGGCADTSSCGGGGGWHGRHSRWGRGFGPFGRFGFFRLVQELNLSPEQWHQGQDILRELRSTLQKGREDFRGAAAPLLSILADANFDAARAEEVAKTHDATFAQVRSQALAALERLHRLLTPEQRERLRRFLADSQLDK